MVNLGQAAEREEARQPVTRLLIAVAACLALLGAAYAIGHRQGTAALQARLDAATVAAQTAAAETASKLAAAEQARRAQAQAFEDQLNALPDTGAVCLPSEWLR